MALNDLRGLAATTPTLFNAIPVREVSRRSDLGSDFAQVMAEQRAEQMTSDRAADANAAARRDETNRTARDADRDSEAQPAARNNDNDANSIAKVEPAAENAAAPANGNTAPVGAPPAASARSGSATAGDRSRARAVDDSDRASSDAASAASAASTSAKELAGALAVNVAVNPAALAAASANGAASSVATDATAGATAARVAHDTQRMTRGSLVGGDTTGAVPSERRARELADDLAATPLDDRGGNVQADAKHKNARQDSQLDLAVDPKAIAADAPRAAAGAKDRLLEDFEQRFAGLLNAAAEGVARGDGHHALNSGINPAAIAGASAAAGLAADAMPAVTIGIPTPVTQPGFGDALGDRVVMLAHQRVASAQITVTPADLGPVTIGIEMHGQDASLTFTATHPATRAAIEDALPRLREMFANNGLNLAQTSVGGETRRDPGRSHRGTPAGNDGARASNAIDAIGATPVARVTMAVGAPRLIDIRV